MYIHTRHTFISRNKVPTNDTNRGSRSIPVHGSMGEDRDIPISIQQAIITSKALGNSPDTVTQDCHIILEIVISSTERQCRYTQSRLISAANHRILLASMWPLKNANQILYTVSM